MPKTLITTVTCRQCGKQFTAGKYTQFCPDCRKVRARRCQHRFYNKRKQRYQREIGRVYTCIDCGAEYILTSGLQVCCPSCEKAIEMPIVQHGAKVCPRCGRRFYDPQANLCYCSMECSNDAIKKRCSDFYESRVNTVREMFAETAKTKLQIMRMSAGSSQTELAIRSGVSQGSLSAYETGRKNVRNMSDDLASRIAAVLECSSDDVRTPIDNPQPRRRFKELRHAAGITQVELGRQIGVTQAAISAYERGISTSYNMNDQLAERIAAVLHCTPSEIKEDQ